MSETQPVKIEDTSIAARMFAGGEAMVGQLSLAVFVARLVGLYTGYELRRDH